MMTPALVHLADLRPDLMNPRIPEHLQPSSPRDAYREIASWDTGKFMVHAEHIAMSGLNPSTLPIVLDVNGIHVVKDGNRRLAALRGLETPALFSGILSDRDMGTLQRLSMARKVAQPEQVLCAVTADEAEADYWVDLTHRGEAGGAGTVRWNAREGTRFDERRGKANPAAPADQVLRYVEQHGNLTDDVRQVVQSGFPITTLARLINTPEFRRGVGLDYEDGRVVTTADVSEVLRRLERIVSDLALGERTVSSLKNRKQRLEYLAEVAPDGEPPSVRELPVPLDAATPTAKRQVRRPPSGSNRKKFVPPGLKLEITQRRTADVFKELRSFEPKPHTNSCWVMLRIFMEWTVEHYIAAHGVEIPKRKNKEGEEVEESGLKRRFNAVVAHMVSTGRLTKPVASAVQKEAGRDGSIMAIQHIQDYVHNYNFIPRHVDLIPAWDHYQPLFEAAWAPQESVKQ